MRWIAIVVSVFWSVTVWAAPTEKSGLAWVWAIEGEYADVRDDLVSTIEGRGLVISYISHARSMLDRTAEAVEASAPVYTDAEILLFCKADLSHHLVAADPRNIVLCPYAIAVYALHGDTERVYAAIRAPTAEEPAYAPVTALLSGIIDEVADGY